MLALTSLGADRRVSLNQTNDSPAAGPSKLPRIEGVVVDSTGQPQAEAVVTCERLNGGGPADGGVARTNEVQSVTTGADGRFQFQSAKGNLFIVGRKPGLAPAWAQVMNQKKDLTDERLVLTASSILAGAVADAEGQPVADAEVWVSLAFIEKKLDGTRRTYVALSGKPARDLYRTRTSAEGKFRLENFPANVPADLAVSKPGKVLRALQRQYVGVDNLRCRGGQEDIQLVLDPAAAIEGKVVIQESGQPLAGARVQAQPSGAGARAFEAPEQEPAISAADGSFRLDNLPAGDFQVQARLGTNAAGWTAEWALLTLETGQTVREVKIEAVKPGYLEVALLDKISRNPLKKGTGVSVNKATYQANKSSDGKGRAFFQLPPGEYRVAVRTDNSREENTYATVETGATNRLEIEVNPPPKVAGTLRDPAGSPVSGMTVTLHGGYSSPNAGETITDANGRFELKWNPNAGGPSRAYCLLARDPARNLAASLDVEESSTNADLRLQPGLIVTGRIEDAEAKPLTNGSVDVQLRLGNMGMQFGVEPIRADARGNFEIKGLPLDRSYYLGVTAKGYGSANQNIEGTTDTNRIELPPFALRLADRKLAGQVLDENDKPVPGAWVNLWGQGQPNNSVRSDAKGRFVFDEVCEGAVQLYASLERASGSARAEAGDTNAVIQLGVNQSFSSASAAPKRAPLKGNPLPDLTAYGLAADSLPAGKPVLLCLFDLEQRPSRRVLRLLAEQKDALARKGITIVALQAADCTAEAWKEWKESNPPAFPAGRVAEKNPSTRWAAGVESLPWLILTDPARKVAAEGFAIDELDARIEALARKP